MRTLLITRNFPPLRGGMERLNERMFRCLHAQDPESALIGPAGSARYAPEGAAVAELPAGPMPLTLAASVIRGAELARRIRPDIVIAGSGLTAPAAVAAARLSGATSAVYLHGLDIIAPSRIYQAAWIPCVRSCQHVIVNSANTRLLAISAGVEPNRIRIVHPGTDLPMPEAAARAHFRMQHGINEDARILLSIGRMTERKGLAEFVTEALPAIVAAQPHTLLVVIGDQAQDALHRGAGAGFARVRAAAEAKGLLGSIMWLGPCDDVELSNAYQGADVHVFPVRDLPGDVEGFGMVAIEAAAHGLPTVAFDVGGVSDAVVDEHNGLLIHADDYDSFARAVIDLLSGCDAMQAERVRAFAQEFSWDRFGREIGAALGQME